MNNSIFILCKQPEVLINRLHIVTLDIEEKNYYIEYGLEINPRTLKSLNIQISILLSSSKKEDFDISEGILNMKISDLFEQYKDLIYIIFLLKISFPPFRLAKKELTREVINYDLRVNECRTAPLSVIEIQKKYYYFMPIDKCFCFHIAPISHSIGFLNSKKLKNIRELESETFQKYLGEIARRRKLNYHPITITLFFVNRKKHRLFIFYGIL